MDSYKIDTRNEEVSIVLSEGEGTLKPLSPSDPGYKPEEQTKLSQILQNLNDAFATDFTDDDRLLVTQITRTMMDDEDLMNKVKNNPKENVSAIFGKFFNKALLHIYENNERFYNKINDNEQLKEQLKHDLLDYVYEEQGEQI